MSRDGRVTMLRSALNNGAAIDGRRRAWLAAVTGFWLGAPGRESLAAVAAAGPATDHGAGEGGGDRGAAPAVQRGRRLVFPRDHGAHPRARIEWWYITGWLAGDAARPETPTHGFQLTFFRSRTPYAPPADAVPAPAPAPSAGRFAAHHLLFAHAAITDLAAGRHQHAQRIARWNGDPNAGPDRAALDDADLALAHWRLGRAGAPDAEVWSTQLRAEGLALQGTFTATQPLLLQGDAGFSRKGPQASQASHYYSLPQLAAKLTLELNGRRTTAAGRAWLDHEWSDQLLPAQAVGWDWIGINLLDGSALTAFRLRRADGSALWAGGSLRGTVAGASAPAPVAVRAFDADEVRFEPGRRWRSPATHTDYPVTWQVHTPAGRHTVRAMLDAQELDSRSGTGAVYWEGLAEMLDESGRRVGLGYLEMTGYAAPLELAR